MQIKDWIASFRLRTLPLALSCILGGSYLAKIHGLLRLDVLVLASVTTILLQVLSNLANDYGDGVKGTDNENRVGPQRANQGGRISQSAMRNAIIITTVLALVSGTALVFLALKDATAKEILLFIGLGVGSVVAAITYTVGKKAYGYAGLGDLFVFIFFGLVGVFGVYYLYAHSLNIQALWMALFVGLMSVSVLNMNNMRDIENDADCDKNTLVVKMGFEKAKMYHTVLVATAMIALAVLIFAYALPNLTMIAFVPSLLFVKNIWFVVQNKTPKLLDPELKKLALGTFFTIVLLWISFWIG